MTHLFPFVQGSVTARQKNKDFDSAENLALMQRLVDCAVQFAKAGVRTQDGEKISFSHQSSALHIVLKTKKSEERDLNNFGLIITSIRGRQKKTFKLCRIQGREDVWTGHIHDCRHQITAALRPVYPVPVTAGSAQPRPE